MKSFYKDFCIGHETNYSITVRNIFFKLTQTVFMCMLVLLGIADVKAQVTSGGWNGSSTTGTPSLVDKGNGVIQLTNSSANGKSAAAVNVTSSPYNPNTSDFDKTYKIFFGCTGADNIGSDQGGDGMAFSFYSTSCTYNLVGNSGGGGLGYMNVCGSMITLEFDTYSSQGNSGFDAFYGGGASGVNDEISLHKNGDASDGGRISESNAGQLEDGAEHTVRITYNHTTHLITVYIDAVSKFTATFDIGAYFGSGVTLNQAWGAGKEGATNYQFVSDGAGIISQIGGNPCPAPVCNQTTTVPTIDGTKEALWNGYQTVQLTNFSPSAPPVANLQAFYTLMYDANNLYVFVSVTDNVKNSNDHTNYWQNDGVEIYIDINNDKAGSYGADDFQYALVLNTGDALAAGISGIETKHGTLGSGAGAVVFAQTQNASGYTMEFKFPWNTLKAGYTPTAGTYLGFDVSINDNDGAARVYQTNWWDGSFSEWNDPSKFGSVLFGSCSPLPVSFLSFTGKSNDGAIVLDWATSVETKNHKFAVERSNNLKDWTVVGEVAGQGNKNTITKYNFIDRNPSAGNTYYRLAQVDLDGNTTKSGIVAVQSYDLMASISPNPFEEAFTITTNVKGDLMVSIYDVLGKLLYNESKVAENGSILVKPEITGGAYIVTVQAGEFVEHQRMIKK